MKVDKRRSITTKLAYIAGFIDGEGCIRIKKSNQSGNSYYVTLQVTNSNRMPLMEIKEVFGGKVYHQEKAKNKKIYQYYATCNEAVDAFRTLIGFSRVKKDEMELAIKFHDNKEKLSPIKRRRMYLKMRQIKHFNQNYENPELLKDGK